MGQGAQAVESLSSGGVVVPQNQVVQSMPLSGSANLKETTAGPSGIIQGSLKSSPTTSDKSGQTPTSMLN